MTAPGTRSLGLDDAVREVALTCKHAKPRLGGMPIHIHTVTADDTPDGVGDFVCPIAVGTFEYPCQLAEHDDGNRHGLAALDDTGGRLSLGLVVPRQVADQHIGIDTMLNGGRVLIASRISSSETGR